MEENSRPETQPASPDLAAMEGRRNELTRPHSDSSSVTVDHSKDLIRQSTNARKCTTWTDAKHNSYLDALEASFVKQLHYSLGSLSWRSEQSTFDSIPSQQLPVNASYSSDQFTIIRNGSWQKINFEKINFERNKPLLYSAACSHVVVESPQLCNFRCSDSHNTIPSDDSSDCNMFRSEGILPFRGKRIFSHGSTSLEKQCLCHQCHQDAVGGVVEVSDQNFVDEDLEQISTSLSRAKKLKMVKADTSNKDQVVPSENILKTNFNCQ